MSNDCYWELIERVPLIVERGGRALLLDLFDEPICWDADCLVHDGAKDMKRAITWLADQNPSDEDFQRAVTTYLQSIA